MSLLIYFQATAQNENIDLTPKVELRGTETVFVWNLNQTKRLAQILIENKSNKDEIKLLDQLVINQDSIIQDLSKTNNLLKQNDLEREKQLGLKELKYIEVSNSITKCESDIKDLNNKFNKKDKNYRRYRKMSLIAGGILVGLILIK